MQELNPDYLDKLETLAGEIQESDELQQYLEEEEEALYLQLKDQFEPRIGLIYEEVAANDPLQIVALETVLLDEAFEGLYLPRILGYSVLRGEVDEHVKYVRPQDHFREVLLAICESSNFDILKKRIGQSIQMGFALSSDIWTTNLINSIENKRVRHYLQSQKIDKYRREQERLLGYQRYRRQFSSDNFYTAEFPENPSELTIYYNSLRDFLLYRVSRPYPNDSLIEPLDAFVGNESLQGADEHLYIMLIYGAFFDMPAASREQLTTVFNRVRAEMPEAEEKILSFLRYLHQHDEITYGPEAEQRLATIVDQSRKDEVTEYFKLMNTVHSRGYTSEEAQEAVKAAYNRHQGLSLFNENVRRAIFQYFQNFISNLEERDYPEYFEISKLFAVYMQMFGNQQFNQDLKDLSMAYITRLLKAYTDKRGKDYQDIKRFVSTSFPDFGFLTEKEIVELFKTRRKRKKTEA